MVNRGQFSKSRSVTKIIATTATAAALTLVGTAASASGLGTAASASETGTVASASGPAPDTASAPNGTVAGINSLYGITCPTATACVSVGLGGINDNIGKSAIVNATTGTAKAWSGGLTNDPLNAVACPADATTCLAVADDAVATVSVPTGAMKVTAKPKPPPNGIVALGAIACASATVCYAVGFEGTRPTTQAIVLRLTNAGKIAKTTVDTGTGSGTITCPTATRCLLTDYKSPLTSIQVMTGGKIGASNPMPADTYVQSMSCYKATLCYALGGNSTSNPVATNELFPVNPTTGAPGAMTTISGFSGTSITCISATLCLVTGFTGEGATAKPAVVAVTKGTPGTPVDYPGQGLTGIGCATATLCYAVGETGGHAIVDKVKP
jgi:hypothetical protein